MSAQKKRSAKSILLGLLLDDPWRKLASIVLAVLLWHYLDDIVTTQTEVPATIVTKGSAEDLTGVEARTLVLRLDQQKYTKTGTKDSRAGPSSKDLDSVKLVLSGPKHLIKAADDEAVFQVVLDPESRGERTVAEFDVTDVKAVSSRYQGLVRSMDPPKVLVELGLNISKTITLSKDGIEIQPPPNSPGFSQRLVWDDVRFDPASITIRGPSSDVSPLAQLGTKLWIFAPQPPTPGQSQISEPLELLESLKQLKEESRIHFDPERVQITIPLRVVPREYTLVDVPVFLTEPVHLRGRFQVLRDTETIKIEAFKTLDGKLHGLAGEPLKKWIEANAAIIAALPADADGAGDIRPRLLIKDHTEGVDFRVTLLPTIRYDLKQQ